MGDVGAKALTAAFVLALVRWLSPQQFAGYVYISAVVILAATLFNGFFNRHYILAGTDASAARAYRLLQVGMSAAVYGAAALLLASDAPPLDLLAGLLCAASAANFDFRRTHAQKQQQFRRYSTSDVARALLLVLLAVPVVAWPGVHTVAALLAAQALAFALAAQLLPPLPATPDPDPVHPPVWRLLTGRGSLALLGYFALVGLFGQLPVLALKQFADAHELATFGAAFRYYGLLLGIVAAANVVILPRIARADDLAQSLRGVASIVAVALAMLVCAALAGYLLIPWIDGGKYPQAPLLFVLLCLGLLPGIVLAPMTAAFLRMDRHGELLRSQLAAVLACALAAWSLRAQGAWAAAWSVPAGVLLQFVWLAGAAALARRGGTS